MSQANKNVFFQSKLENYFKKEKSDFIDNKEKKDFIDKKRKREIDTNEKLLEEINNIGYSLTKKRIWIEANEKKYNRLTEFLYYKKKEFNLNVGRKEKLERIYDYNEKKERIEKQKKKLNEIEKEIDNLIQSSDFDDDDDEDQAILEREVGQLTEEKKNIVLDIYELENTNKHISEKIKNVDKEIKENEKEIEKEVKKIKEDLANINKEQKKRNDGAEFYHKNNMNRFKYFYATEKFK